MSAARVDFGPMAGQVIIGLALGVGIYLLVKGGVKAIADAVPSFDEIGTAIQNTADAASEAVGVNKSDCCQAIQNNDRLAGLTACPGNDWDIMLWMVGGSAPLNSPQCENTGGASGSW